GRGLAVRLGSGILGVPSSAASGQRHHCCERERAQRVLDLHACLLRSTAGATSVCLIFMRVSYGRRPGRRYTFVIYRPRGVCPVDVQAHHGRALRPWSSAQKELEIRTEGRIPWAGGEVVCVTLMAPRRPTASAGAARTGRGSDYLAACPWDSAF